jgi:D-serine deaminase-like pyridoxal phosphate-dependent protein
VLKHQLPTPSLVVNLEVLEKNIRVMASLAKEVGVQLRPHIKTHKNVNIAKMQLDEGAIGVTCATVSEAEVMVAGGIEDIFIAYPLFGDYQLTKAAELNKKCRLKVGFDSALAAERWSRFGAEYNTAFNLVMIVNTGGNRDGVLPEEALELATSIEDLPHIKLMGVMTHEGHMHQNTETASMLQAARMAAEQLVFAAERLRQAGFEISTVSSGSSPACQGKTQVTGITEWRPGTYVFNDLNEMKFVINGDDVALKVLATVVSNPSPGRFIVDAGSKVLSEGSRPGFGHGFIPSVPEARIIKVNEEHGIIEAKPDAMELGQRVEIIPIHVCTVVNLSNGYYLEKPDGSLEYLAVDARGLVW